MTGSRRGSLRSVWSRPGPDRPGSPPPQAGHRQPPDESLAHDDPVARGAGVDVFVARQLMLRPDRRAADGLPSALAVAVVLLTVGTGALLSLSPDPLAGLPWLWLLVPAPALAVAALAVMTAGDNAVRACRQSELERELWRRARPAPAAEPRWGPEGLDARSDGVLTPPPGGEPAAARRGEAVAARPGEAAWRRSRRVPAAVVWVLADVLLVATAVPALGRAPVLWSAVVAGALYLAVLLALNLTAWRHVVRAEQRRAHLQAGAPGAGRGPRATAGSARRPGFSLRYVLWPRPDDSLVKFSYMGVGFFAGWLAAYGLGLPWPAFVNALAFFVVFELVVYPARYILNDARDLERDRLDPNPRRRAKCPDLDRQPRAMFVSFVVRACLAGAYLAWLAAHPALHGLAWAFGLACAALVAYSWWYEAERDRTTRRPPGTTAGWLPLWLAVSCGGGLRLALGVYLGLTQTWALVLVLAVAAGMAMHLCLATMVWALEASDRNPLKPHLQPLLDLALRKLPERRSRWLDYAGAWFPALPLAAEEPSWPARLTLRGEGLERLRTSAPVVVAPRRLVTPATRSLEAPAWRPAPWDWATVTALALGLTLGTVGAVGPATWSAWTLAWSLPLAAATGWLLVRSRPAYGAAATACALALAAVALTLQYQPSRWAQVGVAGLAFAIPAVLHLAFRSATWAGLTRDRYRPAAARLRRLPAGAARLGYRWFVRPRGGRHEAPPRS